jgi:hypothetical protein
MLQEQGISVRKHTNNMDAYDAFLQGMEYTRYSTKESNTQARQRFQHATKLLQIAWGPRPICVVTVS